MSELKECSLVAIDMLMRRIARDGNLAWRKAKKYRCPVLLDGGGRWVVSVEVWRVPEARL
jgi:hypothetical protein